MQAYSAAYDDYLSDESRMTGRFESISFPTDTAQVSEIMRRCNDNGVKVTVQGARTGLSGGAVPLGGHVLNLSKMNRLLEYRPDAGLIRVEAGMTLLDLRERLRASGLFFPPDPTETSASIGGMLSLNASGACSYLYGPTRGYVAEMTVVLANGDILEIKRGETFFTGRELSLRTASGVIPLTLPALRAIAVKSVAGYYCREGMDLIDLWIGSEGTLGVITSAGLRLKRIPETICGLLCFFGSRADAVGFARDIKAVRFAHADISAVEFFGESALKLVGGLYESVADFRVFSRPPSDAAAGVYIELAANGSADLDGEILPRLLDVLLRHNGSDERVWLAESAGALEQLKAFRHAPPAAANIVVDRRRVHDKSLTSIFTDLAVPGEYLTQMLDTYEADMAQAGLEYIIYGHIGDSHLHVNILPGNAREYTLAMGIYDAWARKAAALGGTVTAEHGAGRQKAGMLGYMFTEAELMGMRALKKQLDANETLR